ncbi:hypothetical protein [Streptomyces sp. NBC_00239]|uniref:hypothetical protein n=1 Tax=Streptomyces sp. NBC_00239 TaxID=2903640 RepID=UPI002E29D750|nr:hypothetical protein [Streptomyces sp. NBC_00239]
MATFPRIVVHAPDAIGGRRVHVDSTILGRATSVRDLVEFFRRAEIPIDEDEIPTTPLIEWRGGGPDVWPAAE